MLCCVDSISLCVCVLCCVYAIGNRSLLATFLMCMHACIAIQVEVCVMEAT